MEDHQVVAAILTVALCSTKPRTTSHKLVAPSTLNAALAVESRCEAIVPVATKADSSRVSGPYNRRAGAARAINGIV